MAVHKDQHGKAWSLHQGEPLASIKHIQDKGLGMEAGKLLGGVSIPGAEANESLMMTVVIFDKRLYVVS